MKVTELWYRLRGVFLVGMGGERLYCKTVLGVGTWRTWMWVLGERGWGTWLRGPWGTCFAVLWI